MNTPIILAVIAAACVLALLIAAYFAPVGYEDATGFHRTPSPCERDAQDGRGDLREGAGTAGFHTGLNLTTREQDIA